LAQLALASANGLNCRIPQNSTCHAQTPQQMVCAAMAIKGKKELHPDNFSMPVPLSTTINLETIFYLWILWSFGSV
jgi:hypothetical protein